MPITSALRPLALVPVSVALFVAVPLAAQAPVEPAAGSGTTTASPRPERDPNEMICERQEVTGSRLGSRRVCMTRAQWAQQRRDSKDLVDRSQLGSCLRQAGC